MNETVCNRHVVACVVTHGERTCLLRRSQQVSSERGLWHCVTGYLEPGLSARSCVRKELHEELALGRADVVRLESGPRLRYPLDDTCWLVHTFRAEVAREDVRLNWENDEARWTSVPHEQSGAVWWLSDVYRAVAPQLLVTDDGTTPSLTGSRPRSLTA